LAEMAYKILNLCLRCFVLCLFFTTFSSFPLYSPFSLSFFLSSAFFSLKENDRHPKQHKLEKTKYYNLFGSSLHFLFLLVLLIQVLVVPLPLFLFLFSCFHRSLFLFHHLLFIIAPLSFGLPHTERWCLEQQKYLHLQYTTSTRERITRFGYLPFLAAFAALRSAIKFVQSVRLYVRNNSRNSERIFMSFDTGEFH
jgi:hypothetical protein